MRFSLNLVLSLLSFSLVSCASYMGSQAYKSCKKTNWFNHGHQIAMNGQTIEQDELLQVCKKVKVKPDQLELTNGYQKGYGIYCGSEHASHLGQNGQIYYSEICPTKSQTVLKEKHQAGVSKFCRKDNAYKAGLKGNKYNMICPKEAEAAFLPEFNRGRKKYLMDAIQQNDKKISELKKRLIDLENEKIEIERKIAGRVVNKTVLEKDVKNIEQKITGTQGEIKDLQDNNSANIQEMVAP